MNPGHRPHIVLVVARGEAVRNFVFSSTLQTLGRRARVTLLSLVDHGEVIAHARPHVEQILPLNDYRHNSLAAFTTDVLNTAHYRWIWTEAAKYYWGKHDARVKGRRREWLKLQSNRAFSFPLANRPLLDIGTRFDRWLNWRLRPTRDFDALFERLQPDLVFNGSHIHGPQADLPLRVAARLGIPTAAFVFSWDNLSSRGRIFPSYDYFLMWNEGMKAQLTGLYPEIDPGNVIVTGTPQFDFHFQPEYTLPREELARRVGLDPERPFILYTTGMDPDFAEEHRIVRGLIDYIKSEHLPGRPQLLVRTYIKGTSPEMLSLSDAMRADPDVVFPPILWDRQWVMPLKDDLYIYTSLLKHTALGINGASTVTLELMMLGKPVINLGFEPPGSSLPHYMRFSRHVGYEHYKPVAESGGVMLARSMADLFEMLRTGLANPGAGREAQQRFTASFFGPTLDGCSGARVAEALLSIAGRSRA